MARLTFTQDNLPTPEEFERMLEEAMKQSNPADELLEAAEELREHEEAWYDFSRVLQAVSAGRIG